MNFRKKLFSLIESLPVYKIWKSSKSLPIREEQKDIMNSSGGIDDIDKGIEEDLAQTQKEYKEDIDKIGKIALRSNFLLGCLLVLVYFIMTEMIPFFMGHLPQEKEIINKLLEDWERELSDWKILLEISLIIGITFVANSISAFIEKRYAKSKYTEFFKKTKKSFNYRIKSIKENDGIKWLRSISDGLKPIMDSGLKTIHSNRDDIIPILTDYLKKKCNKMLRVISYDGLEELRKHFDKNKMNEFINNGLVLHILLANHSHFHWIQQKIDMQTVINGKKEYDVQPLNNNYEEEIESDKNWISDINKNIKEDKKRISIKYHNSLPSNYCIITDNRLFISGKMIGDGKISDPPIYEYINNGNDESKYKKYLDYFDLIWRDEDLSSEFMEIKMTPKLLINNEIINKILQNTCTTMTAILRTIDKNSKVLDQRADLIRAFLTVVDYGEPIVVVKDKSGKEKKVTRRYNTNVVSRYDSINLDKCNNLIDKRGYPITNIHAIGSTILSGKYYFKKINPGKEPQDVENFKSCASLVLPIIGQKEENISYIEEWNYKIDNSHTIENISETIIFGNIRESKSKVIATVTFEFGEEIESHIISIPKESQNACEYDKDIIEFNDENGNLFEIEIEDKNTKKTETKKIKSELSTRRLKDEAERSRVLICTYLGLDNSINMKVGDKN
jgi:hypothetical protein